ncbi:amino acid ABC transporter permease [uncultured Serratia sp.]|uniref:amino acid ABC transporter permease n=1 Tax=uncultured Serratia sp. TaxID=239175 RepID=UPI00338F0E21
MTYQLNFSALWPYMPELLAGLLTTMALTALATLMGVALGICGAAIRSGRAGALSRLWGVYVEVVRNTPFVVQLFFIVFGLPSLGWKLTAGQAALLAMVINLGAYSTEIIRAGIQVTPKGQWEAGRVLGLSRSQTFFRIILPQVIKRILPSVTNEVITLVKDTSLAFTISVLEMFAIAKALASSQTSMIPFVAAGVFYYIFNLVVAVVMEWIEKKLSYYE